MASILISSVGASIGGFAGGAIGASVGRFAGSMLGRFLDQKLLGANSAFSSHGPRLKDLHIQSSAYGHMIPVVFGTARLAGNIIWARPIRESAESTTNSSGGKGARVSATRTEYSYFATFAVSICEGEVDEVIRIYANEKLINSERYNIKIYKGSEDQFPDPTIQKYEGLGNVPAYRGQAYAVFEEFPISEFHNHIPNLVFEVRRTPKSLVQGVSDLLESIVVIPGSGEFVYDTICQNKSFGTFANNKWCQRGTASKINKHNNTSKTDSIAALDQMQKELPNLKWVAPVVTWFVDSTDIKDASINPAVEYKDVNTKTSPDEWSVAGKDRFSAADIKKIKGNPIYGGTPSDNSIIRYLDKLKSRGYNIMFYPMFFINKYDKPWRGRLSGSANEVSNFFNKSDGYNNFILHYANLVKGKVDAFLIGSELVSLTKIKNSEGEFVAVKELINLANKVKEILGNDVKISYAADWSEYHHDDNGVHHLDDLWASDSIDFIGVDAYFPLTNNAGSTYDVNEIMKGWQSGEGYDYYYEDSDKKVKKQLSPEYAWKNLRHWWENKHKNPDGKLTKWVPKSKPIWFTEYGFPSVDSSTNQPNVFYDPTSSESKLPHLSSGTIDYKAQRQAIIATELFWKNNDMVQNKFLWCYDARPYPNWPDMRHIWSDYAAYQYGHWIQGKTSCSFLDAVIEELMTRCDLDSNKFKIKNINDSFDGMLIDQPMSAKDIIEVLKAAYSIELHESEGNLNFSSTSYDVVSNLKKEELILQKGKTYNIIRAYSKDFPKFLSINFINPNREYKISNQQAIYSASNGKNKSHLDLPLVLSEESAKQISQKVISDIWANLNIFEFAVSLKYLHLRHSDVISLEIDGRIRKLKIINVKICEDYIIKIQACELLQNYELKKNISMAEASSKVIDDNSETILKIFEFRSADSIDDKVYVNFVAAGLNPNWQGAVVYMSSDKNEGFEPIADIKNAGAFGKIIDDLKSVNPYQIDYKNIFKVNLINGDLENIKSLFSEDKNNFALIGEELIRFQNARLTENFQFQISKLARGIFGTENEIDNHEAGDDFILLNEAVIRLELDDSNIGKTLYFKAVTYGQNIYEVAPIPYKIKGTSQKPLSVVDLKIDAAKASWKRRGITSKSFYDYTDIPHLSNTENYMVEYELNDGTVLQEIIQNTECEFDEKNVKTLSVKQLRNGMLSEAISLINQ